MKYSVYHQTKSHVFSSGHVKPDCSSYLYVYVLPCTCSLRGVILGKANTTFIVPAEKHVCVLHERCSTYNKAPCRLYVQRVPISRDSRALFPIHSLRVEVGVHYNQDVNYVIFGLPSGTEPCWYQVDEQRLYLLILGKANTSFIMAAEKHVCVSYTNVVVRIIRHHVDCTRSARANIPR